LLTQRQSFVVILSSLICAEELPEVTFDDGFAILMAGVATDYTEIISIKATVRRWMIALLLPGDDDSADPFDRLAAESDYLK